MQKNKMHIFENVIAYAISDPISTNVQL